MEQLGCRSKMNESNFTERRKESSKVGDTDRVTTALLKSIPGAIRILSSSMIDDLQGTDKWVELDNGQRIAVDLKIRAEDPIVNFHRNDLALEIWSSIETQKVGWTRDRTKKTDFVFWYFRPTGRTCLIPFRPLLAVMEEWWEEWYYKYQTDIQESENNGQVWHSECVFVPKKIIWAVMYRKFLSDLVAPVK